MDYETKLLNRLIVISIVLFVTLSCLAVPIGWAFRWFETPFKVTDPDRVERLSRQANEMYSQLQAQKSTIQANRERLSNYPVLYGDDRANWPQGKRQEYEQLTNTVTTMVTGYNQLCGQYRAMWADEWRDIPAPDDLPKTCEYLQ